MRYRILALYLTSLVTTISSAIRPSRRLINVLVSRLVVRKVLDPLATSDKGKALYIYLYALL